MLNTKPKPLPQKRLLRLVDGLRQRTTSSAQLIAEQIVGLEEQRSIADGKHEAAVRRHRDDVLQRQQQSTIQWDETLHQGWDSAEVRAYQAIRMSIERRAAIKEQTASSKEAFTAEAKANIAKIEKRFLVAKEEPLNALRTFRQNNQTLNAQLQSLDQQLESALAHRGLSRPSLDEEKQIPTPQFRSGQEALTELQRLIGETEATCSRIANHPLAKFVESIAWWVLCGFVLVAVTTALAGSGAMSLVPAIVAGCCATVLVLVGGLVAVRPFMNRIVRSEYPKAKGLVRQGAVVSERAEALAVEENDRELKRLAEHRDQQYKKVQEELRERKAKLQTEYDAAITELTQNVASEKLAARSQLDQTLHTVNQQFEAQLRDEAELAESQLRTVNERAHQQQRDLQGQIQTLQTGGAQRLKIASAKAVALVTRNKQWCDQHYLPWEGLAESADWPGPLAQPILPLGQLSLPHLEVGHAPTSEASDSIESPLLYSPLDDGYLTVTGDPTHPVIGGLVRNLIMRALTALPPGKVQVCVVDSPGLGRDFGWLMHLADYDPQLVYHRVWTQPGHITRQVETLATAAEDFIQQSLRNQYRDIAAYNEEAGALAEPYRLLVWSGLPAGLEDPSWNSLSSLLDSGTRCGILPILLIDPRQSWPSPHQQELVMRRGTHLSFDEASSNFRLESNRGAPVEISPFSPANDEIATRLIDEVGRQAVLGSRIEVPLAGMLPPEEQRWQSSSSQLLEIPIGQSGVGRVHSLKLGIGTEQHAIIAGKTGSGKSSLLHAMITSAIMKYSPESLRLVLLDFKKGVEFQVYSQAQVPHADIIGIESHREFGLSALQYIDACMQRRGEKLRAGGVQDLASWNALHPESILPRILLVIDEFQELFVEDDKLGQQASLLLDRIVRQGRSFGVHAVLSSQTLAGAYSLPRTTLGQMAVRIALQCDPSDAQIIFAEDNPAAARLKHPGQAVYNNAGGRIEGNHSMQIGWMTKEDQAEWFTQLQPGYRNPDGTTNQLGHSVIFDGNRAASWNAENATRAIESALETQNPEATWCVVGESVAISPAVVFPLTRQAGRNVLVVGPDDAQAAAVLNSATTSLVRANAQAPCCKVYAIQGAKPTDAHALQLPKAWQQLQCDLTVVQPRQAKELISELHAELQRRLEKDDKEDAADAGQDPVVCLNLVQISRMRDLRREDDFSMSSFDDSAKSADKMLEELLADGPGHGMFTMAWADSNSAVGRWLSRTALREIEVRLLMQMSANDSTNLIDSVAASKLGDHVMLAYDEATGQEQPFRPYRPDSLAELAKW